MDARATLLPWILVMLLNAGHTSAAEFSVSYHGKATDTLKATIQLKGDIVAGDANQFRAALREISFRKAVATNLKIYSRGGSVREALEIGYLVRKLGISTSAPTHTEGILDNRFVSFNVCELGDPGIFFDHVAGQGDVDCECTSACALIWAAGMSRSGTRIGFHRPYLRADELGGMRFSEAEQAQNQIFSRTREYLLNMGIPESIVTKMMSASSKDIYFLNEAESDALGFDPAYDEWLWAKCPERLTTPQQDDMYQLLYQKVSGTTISASDRKLLALLEAQDDRARMCLRKARLEFLKERQGL